MAVAPAGKGQAASHRVAFDDTGLVTALLVTDAGPRALLCGDGVAVGAGEGEATSGAGAAACTFSA